MSGDLKSQKEAIMPAQTQLPIAQHQPSDLVFVSQTGKLATDSFLVAEYFSKPHKDVLAKVRQVNCSTEFTERNFSLCHKNNELQNNKIQPFYQMTKDGFMFLVMGFTGKKAAAIKEAYITAFNQMAEKLKSDKEKQLENFNPNLYKDFTDLKEHVNFRVLIEIRQGVPAGFKFVDEDAFVCNKERFVSFMKDKKIFTNQEIITVNSLIAKRLAAM